VKILDSFYSDGRGNTYDSTGRKLTRVEVLKRLRAALEYPKPEGEPETPPEPDGDKRSR